MQIPLELDHEPSFALEDFIVSETNKVAFETIKSWPDWQYHVAALIGPEASGKSHLAISWAKNSNATVFTKSKIPQVEEIEHLGNIVLEDVYLAPDDEHSLFHLINWSKENNRYLLLTSRDEPTSWKIDLPDLKSRLSLVQVANIQSPDDQLLMILLAKMFTDRQLNVDLSVINFMIPRMERSFSAARELVAAMDAKALSKKKAITQKIAKECLIEMKML
jgi:chromosomal replication initiation ATPase DnaA